MNCLIAYSDSCRIDSPIPVICMGGAIFEIEHYYRINRQFNQFKADHRLNEIKLRSLNRKFFPGYAELLEGLDFTAIITIVDETQLRSKYAYPDDPNAYAFELLIERFGFFSRRNDSRCLIIHDEEKILELRARLNSLKQIEFDEIFGRKRREFESILDTLLTTTSHFSVGGQIADTVADVGKFIVKSYYHYKDHPKKEIAQVILRKLDRDEDGEMLGWGIKYQPDENLDKAKLLALIQSLLK